jgi:hypothetical protein
MLKKIHVHPLTTAIMIVFVVYIVSIVKHLSFCDVFVHPWLPLNIASLFV